MTLQKTLNTFFKPAKQVDKDLANQNTRDRYAAKKLAKKLGVNLSTSRDSYGWSCWVEAGEQFDFDDEMFCTSWSEVLATLDRIESEMNK
jgi:hypothetical protein